MKQAEIDKKMIEVNGKQYLFSSVCRSLGITYSKLEKETESKPMGMIQRQTKEGIIYSGIVNFLDIQEKVEDSTNFEEVRDAIREKRMNIMTPFILEAEKNEYIYELKNRKLGRLTVLHQSEKNKRGLVLWKCQCSCGNVTYVESKNLRKGIVQSCGCLRNVKSAEHRQKIKESNLRENLSAESLANKKRGSQLRSEGKEYRTKLSIANRGENAITHKVTEEEVRKIKSLWKTGSYTTTAIADNFPISRQSIADIVYGRTWKHIE